MKLKCTIGSHDFVGGPTYTEGDEYELEDDELAKRIIKWGYAEEISEIPSSAGFSPLVEANKKPIFESDKKKKEKTPKKS